MSSVIYPPDTEPGSTRTVPRRVRHYGSRTRRRIFRRWPLRTSSREVREQGGVTVAAHVTSDQGGMLKVLRGQTRIRGVAEQVHLLAVQIPGTGGRSAAGSSPDRREQQPGLPSKRLPPRRSLRFAAVNAKDIVHPDDLEDRSATCWIKMSEVSIEGLRQAFLDPGSRIRLNPTEGRLEPEEHSELLSLCMGRGGSGRSGGGFQFPS